MRFSGLVGRIGGDTAGAWDIHYAALKARKEGRSIINLSVGDSDLSTPAPVIERAVETIRAGDTHYAEVDGRIALRKRVAEKHSAVTGCAFGPDNIRVYAGAQNALFASMLCLFEAGDEVIVPEPCYVTYDAVIGASGARPVKVPQSAASGFRPDPDAIARAVNARTQGILITTPNNPTGVVMTAEELAAIAEIARKHDLWVVSDEVYGGLTFEKPHIPIAGLPDMAQRTVTISSLSKSHAMTGWRIGWAAGPEALTAHMSNLSLCMLYGLPGFIQEAAAAAFDEGESAAAQIRNTFRRRRDLAAERLADAPGLAFTPPEAGMFLMIGVEGTGMTAHDFAWALLRETGVAVLSAAPFGPSAEGYVRLSFASSDEDLEDACARINRFARSVTDAGADAGAAARSRSLTEQGDSMTLGEYLVQLLERYGVDTVFGLPGVHTVELYRGLPQTRIRHITPRHEQGAGFMADGYARASQKPGVCFIITGPGMTNIATAMGQAYADSIPMLVISSVNRLNTLGMGGGELHELNGQSQMISHVAAFSATVTRPDMLPGLIARAFAVFTSGRQRPVHIEIPIDVMTMSADGLEIPGAPPRTSSPHPSEMALERAAEQLRNARRPVILYGGGAARAPRAALALSEMLDAPSVMTINARGLIPDGHPLAVPASPSLQAVRDLAAAADVVLAVGTEMGPTDYDMYDKGAFTVPGKLIRIDIEGAQTMRNASPDIAITAEARDAMRALAKAVVSPLDTGGAERAAKARTAAWDEVGPDMQKQIGFVGRIYKALPGAVITGDSTQPTYACNLYMNAPAHARWFSAASGYGTLGFALPAATGAWLGAPETPAPPVVCLIGDGGLQFTLPELASAADAGANLIVVVWNNRGYGEIKKYMIQRQIRPEGVDLMTPDFTAVARAYGMGAEKLADAGDFEAALARADSHDGPYLIEVDEDLVMAG